MDMGAIERLKHIKDLTQELSEEVQALQAEMGVFVESPTVPQPDMEVPGHLEGLLKTLREHSEG